MRPLHAVALLNLPAPKPPPKRGLTREYTEWLFEQMVRERWPALGKAK